MSGLTLLDINRQLIAQQPIMSKTECEEKIEEIANMLSIYGNNYSMLYSKETSYFTLIKGKDYKKVAYEAIDCLLSFAAIREITILEDSIDFWAEIPDGELNMYKLFPFDAGVIETE